MNGRNGINKIKNFFTRSGKVVAFLLLLAVVVAVIFWYTAYPARGKFKNANTANCLACHTTNDLTVTIWQDSACTVPQASNVTIAAGSTLTFYIKVAGEPPGLRIGAGIAYPANATPRGSNGDQQNPNTWTAYTPTGLMLANKAVFAWNAYNVNMTKVGGTVSTDVTDSDRNGYEVFPVVLNVPPTAPPGTYVLNIYGAGTNGHGGKLASGLTLNVIDTMKPYQITDLKVTYNATNTTMNLTWTTPNPPDNSGSITKFEIYRSTQPIYDLSGATLIATKTNGLAGGTKNTFSDNVSSFPDGTTLYYAVVSYDASGNRSDISTGPQLSAIKQPPVYPVPSMYKPNDGSTLRGTATLVARVTDDSGVTSVTFQRSATADFASPVNIGTATLISGTNKDGLWSCSWNTTTVSDGTWYVRVQASDGTYTSNSSAFRYTVDNTPPSLVEMQAPANGSTLRHVVTLQARAVDNLGIGRVEFQVATDPAFTTNVETFTGATLTSGTATDGVWSLSWSSSIYPNGTVYIRARAYDKAGQSVTSSAFTYTVSNELGTVPHGGYKEYSGSCAKCHSAHNGENLYLSTNISVNGLCTTCHDGTSAQKTHGFPSTYEHLWPEKRVFCSKCHNPHLARNQEPRPLLRDVYNSQTKTGVPSDYQLCFDCHANPAFPGYEETQSVFDIYQFYKKTSNNGEGTRGVDKGHYIMSPTGTYKFADGTDVPQGYQLRCTDCHDQHGSDNKKLLKRYLGTNPNPIDLNDPSTEELTVREERAFCMGCHNGNTNLYNPSDLNPIKWDPYRSSGHTDASMKCSDCHGGDGTPAERAMRAAHAPDIGESHGNRDCLLCHPSIVNATTSANDGSFHHVAANYNPLDADKYKRSQSCLQCHVDHEKFRPDLAAGNQRAKNLRKKFDPVNGTAEPTNYDFLGSALDPGYTNQGGVCMSCHKDPQTKGYDPTKSTPALPGAAAFDASKHNYTVASIFTGDNSTFYANCTKCHNDTLPKDIYMQKGPLKFGVHSSSYESILDPFGSGDPPPYAEEKTCYRCHSTDVNPNAASGKDYYGVATMGPRALNVKAQFNKAYGHKITSYTGLHRAGESRSSGWNSGANRHVECADCHNLHAAKPGTTYDSTGSTWGPDRQPHTADDTLPGVLTGVWGVSVTNSGTLGSPSTTYSYNASPTKTHEVCLKCHSPYGWGSTPPATTHPAGGSQPDIGKQFNPKNYSFHPLFAPGLNQPPDNANPNWNGTAANGNKKNTYDDPFKAGVDSTPNPNKGLDNTFVDGWGKQSLVTCTDCHSVDNSTGDANLPDGPHGSTVKWILRKADPRVTVTLADGSVKRPNQNISSVSDPIGKQAAQNNLCINCHRADVYGYGTRSYTSVIQFPKLSRFDHNTNANCMGPDGDSGKQGHQLKTGTGEALPGCLNCHGGLEPGGIHGSSLGKGTSGTSERGKRFCNGASWQPGHTLGDASGQGTCFNASVTGVNTCVKHTGSGTSFTPTYYYPYSNPN